MAGRARPDRAPGRSWSTTNTAGPIGATLLGDDHWRCVWFDPIAAVFVHDSATRGRPSARRRLRGASLPAGAGRQARKASRSGWPPPRRCAVYADGDPVASRRTGLAARLARPGRVPGHPPRRARLGRRLEDARPDRALPANRRRISPSPRFRLPFDPVVDLSLVRLDVRIAARPASSARSDFTTL